MLGQGAAVRATDGTATRLTLNGVTTVTGPIASSSSASFNGITNSGNTTSLAGSLFQSFAHVSGGNNWWTLELTPKADNGGTTASSVIIHGPLSTGLLSVNGFFIETDGQLLVNAQLVPHSQIISNSAVLGGRNNFLIASNNSMLGSVISGGQSNVIGETYDADADLSSTLDDGETNSANWSVIGGGKGNFLVGNFAGILSGFGNRLEFEQSNLSPDYSVIGGGFNNTNRGSSYSVIGGGRNNYFDAGFAGQFIGGGQNNGDGNNGAQFITIVAGLDNLISGSDYSFIGAGFSNSIVGDNVNSSANTIAGGFHNRITNNATGVMGAAILSGVHNVVSGNYAVAAGNGSVAAHNGSFVWSDSLGGGHSTGSNQFNIFAHGGLLLYDTFTDSSNYRRISEHFSSGDAVVGLEALGTGTSSGDFKLLSGINHSIRFQFGGDGFGNSYYNMDTNRFTPIVTWDNALDLGGSDRRWRSGFFGTSVTVSGGIITNGSAGLYYTTSTPTLALPNGFIAQQSNGQLWLRTNNAWVTINITGGGGGGSGDVVAASFNLFTGPSNTFNGPIYGSNLNLSGTLNVDTLTTPLLTFTNGTIYNTNTANHYTFSLDTNAAMVLDDHSGDQTIATPFLFQSALGKFAILQLTNLNGALMDFTIVTNGNGIQLILDGTTNAVGAPVGITASNFTATTITANKSFVGNGPSTNFFGGDTTMGTVTITNWNTKYQLAVKDTNGTAEVIGAYFSTNGTSPATPTMYLVGSGTSQTVNQDEWVISTGKTVVSGIDGTATGNTTLYTVPAGRTAIINQVIIIPTTVTTLAVAATVSVGKTSSAFADVIAAGALTGLTSTATSMSLSPIVGSSVLSGGDALVLRVSVGATATAFTFKAVVIGRLL